MTNGVNFEYCAGCDDIVLPECRDAWARAGVITVHWECWSQCNLHCPFCYRTESLPQPTPDALKVISSIATAGVKNLVFAGGDPSLHPDLDSLTEYALELGLTCELQTNAHAHSGRILRALKSCASLALSIDGPNAEVHDLLRRGRGNFQRNLQLIRDATARQIPVRVRSVVTRGTFDEWLQLGSLLEAEGVTEWTLQQVSRVGKATTWKESALEAADISTLAAAFNEHFPRLRCRTNTSENKVGLYAMIRSDAGVYTTSGDLDDAGYYPVLGSLATEHLGRLAQKINIDVNKHVVRYGNECS